MRRVFLSTVLRANVIFFSKHEPLMSAWVALLFCKRHGKFMKSHTSGFKKPIKMIETGNTLHLKVWFVIEITNYAPSISRYFIANEFAFFSSHMYLKQGHSGEEDINIRRVWIESNEMFAKYFHLLRWTLYHINLCRKPKIIRRKLCELKGNPRHKYTVCKLSTICMYDIL